MSDQELLERARMQIEEMRDRGFCAWAHTLEALANQGDNVGKTTISKSALENLHEAMSQIEQACTAYLAVKDVTITAKYDDQDVSIVYNEQFGWSVIVG